MRKIKQVAVIGTAEASAGEREVARTVGILLAKKHVTLLSGGGDGVMDASCQGSREAGGLTIGIVPGTQGNPYLDVIIKTRLNQARNAILVESADAIIAIGGGFGTLSEIAYAMKSGIPVFGLKTWDIPGIIICNNVEEAVSRATSST